MVCYILDVIIGIDLWYDIFNIVNYLDLRELKFFWDFIRIELYY